MLEKIPMWDPDEVYEHGDLVLRNGVVWRAVRYPPTGPIRWERLEDSSEGLRHPGLVSEPGL